MSRSNVQCNAGCDLSANVAPMKAHLRRKACSGASPRQSRPSTRALRKKRQCPNRAARCLMGQARRNQSEARLQNCRNTQLGPRTGSRSLSPKAKAQYAMSRARSRQSVAMPRPIGRRPPPSPEEPPYSPLQDRRARINRRFAQRLVDADQLVVFRQSVGARQRAGFDLAAIRGHGQIGNRGVLGLA